MELSEPLNPASAVDRPTAAGDVELSELNGSYPHTHTLTLGLFARVCVTLNPAWLRPTRTEALAVTDKHPAPSVNGTWHRASFGLADA